VLQKPAKMANFIFVRSFSKMERLPKWVVGMFDNPKEPETWLAKGNFNDCSTYLEKYEKNGSKN